MEPCRYLTDSMECGLPAAYRVNGVPYCTAHVLNMNLVSTQHMVTFLPQSVPTPTPDGVVLPHYPDQTATKKWEATEGAKRERRERIAIAAMQGMVSGLYSDPGASAIPSVVAQHAASFADALIAELDKEPK